MANFCAICGTPLDETYGLCPNCDYEQLYGNTDYSGYCSICGAELDAATGLCPYCSDYNHTAQQPYVQEQYAQQYPQEQYAQQYPQGQYIQQPYVEDPQPPKEINEGGESKALTVLVTVLLSISLFITSLFAITIYSFRNAVKEDKADILFNNIEISKTLKESDLIRDDALDEFYDYLSDRYYIDMSNSDLDDLLNRADIQSFASEKVSGFFEDFYSGEDAEISITKKEVIRLLEKNRRYIRTEYDVNLTDSELEKIADWIFKEKELVLMESENLKYDSPAFYYLLNVGFSYVLMGVFILLSLLIIFCMVRNSLSQAACGVGVILIVFGSFFSIIALLAGVLCPIWQAICNGSVVGIVLGNILASNALFSILLLLSGVAILVLRALILKWRLKKQI